MYALTGRRLGASAEDIILLDDTPVTVDSARAAGWYAVQFATAEQAICGVEVHLRHSAGRTQS